MPYPPQTRRQIVFVSIFVAFGAFFVVRELLEHQRNSARLAAFRADPACVAPLVLSHPARSPLCHDDFAVVTARWSRHRHKSRHLDYHVALRLPDGFVDTLALVSDSATWEKAQPGTTFFVRQFAPKDWIHARVIALVGHGTAGWTSRHPVWRDGPSEFLIRGGAIVVLGTILLIILGIFGREEAREETQARMHAA